MKPRLRSWFVRGLNEGKKCQGCHLVARRCLVSTGASLGILFMWDIRVVEKCVGDFTLAVTFRDVVVFPSGLLQVCLAGFPCSFCLFFLCVPFVYLEKGPYVFNDIC
jgi:hypothetical protein